MHDQETYLYIFALILIVIFLAFVFHSAKSSIKHDRCFSYDSEDDFDLSERSFQDSPCKEVDSNLKIFIPREEYLCNMRENQESAICSGNGTDSHGDKWTIVDIAEYQPRTNDDVRRYINMRITNGRSTYSLQGLGQGPANPDPVDPARWDLVVLNTDMLATMKTHQRRGVPGYLIEFRKK